MRTVMIISLILICYTVNLALANKDCAYWNLEMQCSCFHGCYLCGQHTDGHNFALCLEICAGTGATLVDYPGCILNDSSEYPLQRKRRHIKKRKHSLHKFFPSR